MVDHVTEHFPGMPLMAKSRPGGPPHPSFFFAKEHVKRGHVLVAQGQQLATASCFILLRGSLEITRHRPASAQRSQPNSSVAVETLEPGAVGGTLPFGKPGEIAEPFSVHVTSVKAEVLRADGLDLEMLPLILKRALAERLAADTARRLRGFVVGKIARREPEPMPLPAGRGTRISVAATRVSRGRPPRSHSLPALHPLLTC